MGGWGSFEEQHLAASTLQLPQPPAAFRHLSASPLSHHLSLCSVFLGVTTCASSSMWRFWSWYYHHNEDNMTPPSTNFLIPFPHPKKNLLEQNQLNICVQPHFKRIIGQLSLLIPVIINLVHHLVHSPFVIHI